MVVIERLIFDDVIEGTTDVYTDPKLNAELGSPNKFTLVGFASQSSGTSPTLTVQAEVSVGDERYWSNLQGTPEINGTALSTTVRTSFGSTPNIESSTGRMRFRLALGGTAPKSRVQLYFTGRDP